MIEIRADVAAAPANPDGPHSSELTLAIAEGIREASVLLHRATSGPSGLHSALDVYNVLRSLSGAIDTLPATLEQMHHFVAQEADNAATSPHHLPGETGPQGIENFAGAIREATEHAWGLTRALRTAYFSMQSMPPPIGDAIEDQILENMLMEPDDEAPPD